MKLQSKLAIIIFGFGSLSVFSLGAVNFFYHLNKEIEHLHSNLRVSALEKVEHIELTLRERANIAMTVARTPLVSKSLIQSNSEFSSMAEGERKREIKELNEQWKASSDPLDPFIVSHMTNPVARYLKEHIKNNPGKYGEIFLTNRYGVMIATTGKLTTLSHSHKYWWRAAYNEGKGRIFFDDRGFDASVEGYVLGVVAPVIKDGEFIGLLKCNVNIDYALRKLVYTEANRELKVARSGGVVVLEKGKEPLSTKVSPLLVERMKQREIGGIRTKDKTLLSYAPVPVTLGSTGFGFGGSSDSIDHILGNKGEAWFLVISQNLSQALIPFYDSIFGEMLQNALLITLIGFLATVVGRKFALPVLKLEKMASNVGRGDFTTEVKVESNDELGSLAKSLNQMSQNLLKTTTSRNLLSIEIIEKEKAETELKKEITERKQVEEALRKSENELLQEKEFSDAVTNSLPGIFYVYEEGERLIRWNKNHEIKTGYSAKELFHMHPLDWFEGEDKEIIIKAMEQVYVSGESMVEANLVIKDGTRLPHYFIATKLIRDGKNYILGVGLDITDLKKAEEKLRKLSQAVEQSPVSIVITDRAGTIEYVNPMFSEITGYSSKEVIGQNPRVLKSEEHSEAFYKGLWGTITSGQVWNGRFHNRKKDGELFWEQASISPITNEDGEITNFVAVKEDVTEKMRTEEETMRAGQLASIGELAAGVAHEINNPINGMVNLAQLLTEETDKDSGAYDILTRIIDEGTRISVIVRGLLSFAREDEGEKEPVDLCSVMSDCLVLTEIQMKRDNILCKIDIPAELPTITANYQQLQQVFLNIIHNAHYALNRKYPDTCEDKALEISVEETGAMLRISFYDHGTGISPEIMDKLVNPFFSTKPASHGTGLGLSISHGIIRDHGGEISFDSLEGEYTKVTIDLPMAGMDG